MPQSGRAANAARLSHTTQGRVPLRADPAPRRILHAAAAPPAGDRTGFDQVWDPLPLTWHERLMDPRAARATDQEVVALWHQPRRPVSAGRASQQAARQDLLPGPKAANRCVSMLGRSAGAVR